MPFFADFFPDPDFFPEPDFPPPSRLSNDAFSAAIRSTTLSSSSPESPESPEPSAPSAPNVASERVLRSLGFRQEGLFRQSFRCEGEWVDDLYFALLASEWRGGTSTAG